MRAERLLEECAAARGAGAVARRATRRPRRRAVRRRRDPPPRGAAAARGRDGDRRRPRGRPPCRADRRARRARRRATRCASACTPSGCSRSTAPAGSRRRSPPTATRAPGSWSRSASSPAPSCSACTSRSSRTTRRSTCPRRPSRSPRRARRRRRGGGRARCWWARRRSLLAGITAFGVIRVLEPDSLVRHRRGHVGLIDPDGGRITAQYSVGHSPGAVTAGGGSVWVANRLDGTVSRIDRDRQVTTIPVGGAPAALAFGAGSLWVADGDSRSVAQVDPGSEQGAPADRGRQRAALAGARGGRAVGGLGRRRRRPPRRARPPGPRAPDPARREGDRDRRRRRRAVGSERGGRHRHPPRPAHGRVVAPINVGHAPSALAVGEGAVWVVNRTDGTLVARGPRHERGVVVSVRVGRDPTGVAVGEGAVWVAGGEEGTVARVDPDGPRMVAAAQDGQQPVGARGRRRLGVDRRGRARRRRTGAARCGWTCRTPAIRPGELAPRGGLLRRTPGCWQGSRTTGSSPTAACPASPGDARRRAGHAAARAERGRAHLRLHAPTRHPLLRRDAGEAGRLPRVDGAQPGRAQLASFPPYFSGIVGARRCISAGPRCDLSRGIESDAHARTITVHLTAPDPEFLHKLTMPFAYVVPSGTPAHADDPGLRTARHRPVPHRRLGCAPRRRARPQPALPADRRAARRVRGSDRDRGHPARDASRRTPRRSSAAARI